ncbi:SDR family oxidoreductase [Actinoplanes sichuanensis]|uniref:NAD-dependent epimerase/dehydratase family protein n=1 Tax=Actinoplanes sichuanensis TaxID=512349 RepID=A0ABW4ASA3_9ACTN|nr:NAD-dependent epimerase/dehydratase family protein [Actinoplanes sichuanensis]BEL04893.1 SDR family oxidoreductase [Actinoplanes sichuanensis]
MRILVLGGSGFVGRSIAELAAARGDDVTVLNRGRADPPPRVRALTGDRQTPGGLDALGDATWDAVVDTWSADATVVAAAATALQGRAGHYTYISSRSVYVLGEDRLVPHDEPGYAGDKLRGELAAAGFGGPLLLARAGLILGPYENIGRLPWWLNRLHAGGPTLAPGPRDLPLQYIDTRDLAAFVLDAAATARTGPFDLVSPPGHTTMGELLDITNEVTGNHADLRWTDPDTIIAAGIQPWTHLPVWLPPGPLHTALHGSDVTPALAAGLRCRPVRETITDTWTWLTSLPDGAPHRADRPAVGLDPQIEATLL